MRTALILTPDPLTCPARGRRAGRYTLPVLFVLLPTVGACARKDLQSELDRARSWTATTHLAVDRRSANAINGAVTSQLRDRAAKARTQAAQSLGELAKTDSERTAVRAVLDSLDDGLTNLRRLAP